MNAAARQIITALDLEPLPNEGGYFRPTYRSAAGSAILFVITPEDFSAFHRIAQDEIWHFYAGDPVEHVQLDPRGAHARITTLGPAVLAAQRPQLPVPARVWQGARIAMGRAEDPSSSAHGFALLGCTLAPPWDARGFEPGRRADLLRDFPAHDLLIHALTR